ncbi:TniQ family protein [Variovorax sp. LjRoot175]|uniref:TniQ family protein n=1 Tax=Variovorax sp. LjRoot175 TaxID=3342276 RepID=UPI003F50FA53
MTPADNLYAEAARRRMKGRPFPHHGSLYLTPVPVPKEAATSWLQRVAKAHRIPWTGFRRLLGLGSGLDPDFGWPWELESSARFLATTADQLAQLMAWRCSFIAQARPDGVVTGDSKVPLFSLCRACVAESRVVHYRIECRFGFVRLCPKHGTTLMRVNGGRSLASLECAEVQSSSLWGLSSPEPPSVQRRRERMAFEKRICRALYVGYERHPTFGIVPAQTLLAVERIRVLGARQEDPRDP